MGKMKIASEIGKLKKVIIHLPGPEIENMTPETAKELLFNDLLDIITAQREYNEFASILKLHSEVYEVNDLLEELLREEKNKEILLRSLISESNKDQTSYNTLMRKNSTELVNSLVSGVANLNSLLTDNVFSKNFISPPLPNLYFTRDTAAVINNYVLLGSMASHTRSSEAIITKFILKNHPDFIPEGFYFDDLSELRENSGFEGGDILVLREDVLAIGLSERTTLEGVEQLAERLKQKGDVKHIFTVNLPDHRAMIHLDMVFTMLDHNFACVYEPVILGDMKLDVKHIDISEKINRIESIPNLLAGLKTVGIEIEPVFCGGNNRINQDREQWMCGANFFALAPGKVLGYARAENTFLELEKKANMPRIDVADVLSGRVNLDDYDRYAIAFRGGELSRGGGGARCMTFPILREDIL